MLDDGWDGNHGNPSWYPFHLEISKTKALLPIENLNHLGGKNKPWHCGEGFLAYLDCKNRWKRVGYKWNEGIDSWWWFRIYLLFSPLFGEYSQVDS